MKAASHLFKSIRQKYTQQVDVVDKIIERVEKCYNMEQDFLHKLSMNAKTEGEIREAAGNLVENVLQCIFDAINEYYTNAEVKSKVGSTDFLSKKIKYKGKEVEFNTIQVDRHVWQGNKRICFIENKTYLDSCYYDRALSDFRKIAQSLKQHRIDPASCKYIVFAGQNAASDDTLFTYEADFWEDTRHLTSDENGLETKIFFFLKGKRASAKPLYKIKHEIDRENLREFVKYLLRILGY